MNYPALRIVSDVIKINRLHITHLNSLHLMQTSPKNHRLLRQLGHRLSKFGARSVLCYDHDPRWWRITTEIQVLAERTL